MEPKNKKILISGGGIAGCTLAYFLKQYGFNPVIVDSAPEFKHIGYLLALNLQIGQEVAKKMGILEKLKSFEVLLTKNIMYDMNEKLIMEVEATPKLHNENTGLMLNRADLHKVLYDLIKNKVDFRFEEEITAISQNENGAEVTFSNDKKEVFDLVIGADGVHSKTRELIFGKGFEKNIGTAYFAFIIPNRLGEAVAGEHELILIRGKNFASAYHMTGDNQIGGYVFYQNDLFVALSPRNRSRYLIDHYGKYNSKFLQILQSMTEEDPIFHDAFTQVIMPEWYKDRVCLTGDAAHCPTAASGVGASMAMAGSYILATKLSETNDYTKAFEDYDCYLRPYILKTQKDAVRSSDFIAGKSPLPYGLVNLILKFFPVSLITRFHSHKLEMPLP